jgi:hypothetical protein
MSFPASSSSAAIIIIFISSDDQNMHTFKMDFILEQVIAAGARSGEE